MIKEGRWRDREWGREGERDEQRAGTSFKASRGSRKEGVNHRDKRDGGEDSYCPTHLSSVVLQCRVERESKKPVQPKRGRRRGRRRGRGGGGGGVKAKLV